MKVPDVITPEHFAWWPWMQNVLTVHTAGTWTVNFALSEEYPPPQVTDPAASCLCSNHTKFLFMFIYQRFIRSVEGSSILVLRACSEHMRSWDFEDPQAEGLEPNHLMSGWVLCQPSNYIKNGAQDTFPHPQHLTAGFLIVNGWTSTKCEKTHTVYQWWQAVYRSHSPKNANLINPKQA